MSANDTPIRPVVVLYLPKATRDFITYARVVKRSVEPHFDSFKRCFARVSDPKKGGDFGVDLRIEKEGGKANVSHPRTGLKGEGFEECVVKVFEEIDFLKPKGGTTVVSYSLRFTPL